MIPGIFALIQALPELFKLLNRLGLVVARLMEAAERQGINRWIDNLEASIDQLEKAKTPNEKLDAAQSLVDSIRKLN